MLSDSESDRDDSLHRLTINEHYAKAFEYKKEREELQRLKEQYGSDPDTSEEESTDSEELESEDSDGDELTPAMDAAILRTLARIKRKDPKIYESGHHVFDEEQEKTTQSAKTALSRPGGQPKAPKDKSKPLTIRAVNIQSALRSRSTSPVPEAPVTHLEEQEQLRNETIAAFHAAEADDDDDLLVPREKTLDEVAREEEEYRVFLEKEVGDLHELVNVGSEDAAADPSDDGSKKKKKKKKNKERGDGGESQRTKQEEDQDFLVNYILNRGWIDRSSKRVPTYGEVTSQSKSKKGKSKAEPMEDEDADSEAGAGAVGDDETDEEEVFDDIVDRFESSYNFRFEEPDGAEIKSYPRNLPSLVRREDTTRKDARERRKQRKEAELEVRKEEVRRLKGLKMKEIRARLERAGVATGEVESLKDLGIDLDAPWDPEAHDRQMAGLYELGGQEGDDDGEKPTWDDEGEKPTWDDDMDIGDSIPEASTSKADKKKEKKKQKKKKGGEEEDAGVDIDVMDADAVPEYDPDEEWDGTEEMRKRKVNEWMDEVYALDFNDLVGGMPTRFQYASVPSQNFGLSAVDILLAKDAELNEYMSVKKYAPYRADNRAGWDKGRGERLKDLKGKVRERVGEWGGEEADSHGREGPKKKRKGKKERMKDKGANGEGPENAEHPEANGGDLKRKRDPEEATAGDPQEGGGKKKRRRKKKDVGEVET
ncbi:KRI1-like family C-terminal-domain-containing protein [Roridomyces roridus]|uniref:KRI1-like family C-terminal-domain-containing protein n=1 Tax=Roridomyces roridus TaxID=1738132 RepID=A0AAD7CG59_9AGAR|nr:KRI1-like family C-terminal-domain-containing protein [Roridomyces roridus]